MKENNLIILVYRRTHTGDPCEDGRFGCNDCMKSVRNWEYNAVIGIGGAKPDKGYDGIKERITWVGINPERDPPTAEDIGRMKIEYEGFSDFGGNIITFDKFLLLDIDGPLVKDVAKNLYKYMFVDNKIPRAAKNFQDKVVYDELLSILRLADSAPPSRARDITNEAKYASSKCVSSSASPKRGGCA